MNQNNHISNLQLDLLDKRIIDLSGKIDTAMAIYVRYAITILAAQGNPPIDVWISSGGGGVVPGLDIFDLFMTYPNEITGKIINVSESMATVALQACNLRLATRNAKIMIHNPWCAEVSYDEFHDATKLNEIMASNEREREIIMDILINRTGLDRSRLEQLMGKGEILTSQEALNDRLIDGFIPERSLQQH